jgi:hypothetical protein
LILWRGASEAWSAAATLKHAGKRLRETFESQASDVTGLELCLAWLSDFIADHGLPSLALVEAWQRLSVDAVPTEL